MDITLKSKDPKKLANQIMDFINWPNGVIESNEKNDFFWYKDLASKEDWDLFGLEKHLENTMIHFIISDDELTIATEEKLRDSINSFIKKEN